jgi:hypothetical protein
VSKKLAMSEMGEGPTQDGGGEGRLSICGRPLPGKRKLQAAWLRVRAAEHFEQSGGSGGLDLQEFARSGTVFSQPIQNSRS